MKEQVFKVSDLHEIFESIQRDIDELKETKARIPKEREYSKHLIASISEEIKKLEDRREMILNLEVKLPVNALVDSRPEKGLKIVSQEERNSEVVKPLNLDVHTTNKKITRRY
jgi:chromosome segregation ATPase